MIDSVTDLHYRVLCRWTDCSSSLHLFISLVHSFCFSYIPVRSDSSVCFCSSFLHPSVWFSLVCVYDLSLSHEHICLSFHLLVNWASRISSLSLPLSLSLSLYVCVCVCVLIPLCVLVSPSCSVTLVADRRSGHTHTHTHTHTVQTCSRFRVKEVFAVSNVCVFCVSALNVRKQLQLC